MISLWECSLHTVTALCESCHMLQDSHHTLQDLHPMIQESHACDKEKTVSLLGLDSCVAGTKNRSQIHRDTEEVQLKCLISGRQKCMYMLSGFSCKNGTIKCH